MNPAPVLRLRVSFQALKAFISTPTTGTTGTAPAAANEPDASTGEEVDKKLSAFQKLHDMIIPPLPMSPRDSQQLLDEITGSFRRHLAASGTPPTDKSTTRDLRALAPATSWRTTEPVDNHMALLLRQNKLRGWGPEVDSHTRVRRMISDPVGVFEEHVWSGTATLELANFVLRTHVNQVLQAAASPLTTPPPKEDGALILLHLLRTAGLVAKTGPPTGDRTLTNWLTAGLLLSSNPSIPFSWVLYALQQRARNQAGGLLWTILQSYNKIYDEKRTVELFLTIMGHKNLMGDTKTTQRINTKIMQKLQLELTSDNTVQSQLLYPIAQRMYERYETAGLKTDLAEAVHIWNPAPHYPALTAHLALEHFQDPYPGLDFLLNSLPDASNPNLMAAENLHFYYEHSMLGIRVAEAFLRIEQPELAGEALRVVKQRLFIQNSKEARDVLNHMPEEDADLLSWIGRMAKRASKISSRKGIWETNHDGTDIHVSRKFEYCSLI